MVWLFPDALLQIRAERRKADKSRSQKHEPNLSSMRACLCSAVYTLKNGAFDFLQKPTTPLLLNKVIAEASQKSLSTQPKNSQRKEEYARYRSLTPREKEIFKLAADGKTNKEISSLLNIALPTVKMHRGNAFDKLNVHSSVEALKLYDSLGLGEKEDD